MKLRLSLLENSRTFLQEALSKALLAETSPVAWKFAIFALVQAIELAVKERLRREHRILVFANVDKPSKTVSLDLGVARLQKIAGIALETHDLTALENAKNWRDAVVHADIDVAVDQLKAVFARLLGFYISFARCNLDLELQSLLSGAQLEEALSIRDYGAELMRRAEQRLSDETIDVDWVWACRACGFDAFVVQDDICTCYVCGFREPVISCDTCEELHFEDQLKGIHPGGSEASIHLCGRCVRIRKQAEEDDRQAWEEGSEA